VTQTKLPPTIPAQFKGWLAQHQAKDPKQPAKFKKEWCLGAARFCATEDPAAGGPNPRTSGANTQTADDINVHKLAMSVPLHTAIDR
jgi:hypothetical protein